MKLRVEKKFFKLGEDVEVPDLAFDFALNFQGEGVDVFYLVPADEESALKSKATEVAAHLLGVYK